MLSSCAAIYCAPLKVAMTTDNFTAVGLRLQVLRPDSDLVIELAAELTVCSQRPLLNCSSSEAAGPFSTRFRFTAGVDPLQA